MAKLAVTGCTPKGKKLSDMYVIISGVFDDNPENTPAVDFSTNGGENFDPDGEVVAYKPIIFTTSQIVVRLVIKDITPQKKYIRVTQIDQAISSDAIFEIEDSKAEKK